MKYGYFLVKKTVMFIEIIQKKEKFLW